MKKYYVDMENVGSKWIEMIPKIKKKNQIVLYTSKNVHFSADSLELMKKGSMRKCMKRVTIREGWVSGRGNSALDYFLMGDLNNDIKLHPDYKYVIVSNDNDYDSFIEEWRKKGIDICRRNASLKRYKRKKTEERIVARLMELVHRSIGEKKDERIPYREISRELVNRNGNFVKSMNVIKDEMLRRQLLSMITKKDRAGLRELLNEDADSGERSGSDGGGRRD